MDPPAGSSDHRVTVVVITRNRCRDLLRAVAEHVRLPERPPIVVVDNGSTDGTAAAVAHSYPEIELVRLGRNIGPRARNVGVGRAATPYAAFSDDDSWWAPGSLATAVELLDRYPTLGAVTARSLVGPEAVDDPLNAELAASPLPSPPGLPGPRVMGFLACATVVRNAAFAEVGGFHGRMQVGGEEELLACDLARAGWSVAYCPELVVHHHPSTVRSADDRRVHEIRNALWVLWLRRPAATAVRRSVQMARTLPRDRVTLRAVAEAVRGAPAIAREREVVPPELERELSLLDG